VLVHAAIDQVQRGDEFGAEVLERHAAALLERLRDFRRRAHQDRHHLEHAAGEVVASLGGEKVRMLIRKEVGLRLRVISEVTRACHPLQPLLDVARLHARCPHHLVAAHRAFALHCTEKSGVRADVHHAGGHRPGHVAEQLFGD
jgi:hypothetical protein